MKIVAIVGAFAAARAAFPRLLRYRSMRSHWAGDTRASHKNDYVVRALFSPAVCHTTAPPPRQRQPPSSWAPSRQRVYHT